MRPANSGRVQRDRSTWYDTVAEDYTDRFTYTYDRNSNRLTRGWTTTTGKDEAYTYDGLNRLTKMDRGSLSSGSIATPTYTRDWTSGTGTGLDALGNWRTVATDADGSGGGSSAATESRTHDSQNRLTGVGGGTLLYDDNGNLKQDGFDAYQYDAWNRLIWGYVDADDTYYLYDALGRRIQKWDASGPAADHYHSANWQVIEERDSNTGDVTAQNVWSLAYVDAMVLRDRDAASGGNLGKSGSGLDERLYAVQDANFNVTAVVDASGAVVERYQYDPYGQRTVLDASFTPRSVNASIYGVKHGFQGKALDVDTGLYDFNRRFYSPTLGRPISADPLGYLDGMSRYLWERGNPIVFVDPSGLQTHWNHDFPRGVFTPQTLERLGVPDFDIHAAGNGTLMDSVDHLTGPNAIHKGGPRGGDYNREWQNWVDSKLAAGETVTPDELQQKRQELRNSERFKPSFDKGKAPKDRYPGAPKIDKKALGMLAGIAGLIATGQQAMAATGAFAKPGTAAGAWFRRAIDPKFCDCDKLNSGDNFNNMKEQIKQEFRGAGGAMSTKMEVDLDMALEALANFAQQACMDRRRRPS